MIPQEWEVEPLARVAQIRTGIAKNANNAVTDPILVHYLSVANVQDGFLDLSDVSKIRLSRSDLQQYEVQAGDVLMNEGGDLDKLGRGSLWRGEIKPCVHQNHVFVVRCGGKLRPEFLDYWTSSYTARNYFRIAGKQTTNLASINKTALGYLPVVLPRPDMQVRLVRILSDIDALISALDRLIAKKRDLKQAAMQELLTGKRRLPGFTDVWVERALREMLLAYPDYGLNAPGVPMGGGLPAYLRITDINDDGVLSLADRVAVNHLLSKHYLLAANELVIARTGASVGRSYLYKPNDGPFVFAGFLIRLKVDCTKLIPEFLAEYTRSWTYRDWLRAMSMRSGQPGVNSNQIGRLKILLPRTIEEQSAIATVLSDMNAEIAALEQRRRKTRLIKQAMMQELLTGRIRLV